MAKNPSEVVVDISGLPAQVAGLTVKVDLLIKFVAAVSILGAGAIGGQFYMAYGHSTALGNVKQELGKVQGTLTGLDSKLNEILQRLATPAPAQKQGALIEPSPTDFVGWMGVKADSKDELAKALIKTPETKTPVWVYTNEPAAATALENALKAQ